MRSPGTRASPGQPQSEDSFPAEGSEGEGSPPHPGHWGTCVDLWGFAVSWGAAVPELSEMFQSLCTKAGAELGWMQRPAALRMNLQLCREDSQTDRLRLCGLTAFSLTAAGWSRFPGSAGLTLSDVPLLLQDRGNQFELKHTSSLLKMKMSRNIPLTPQRRAGPCVLSTAASLGTAGSCLSCSVTPYLAQGRQASTGP